MARIQMEEIVDYLGNEMRRALIDTVREVLPNSSYDETELFRAFRSAISRRCSVWENVPDNYVEK